MYGSKIYAYEVASGRYSLKCRLSLTYYVKVPLRQLKVMFISSQLSPNSIYNALTHLNEKYKKNITYYITENGWSSAPPGDLNDDDRVRYYRASLESVLDTLDAGVDLKGYMAWSLLDNFEWMMGYT